MSVASRAVRGTAFVLASSYLNMAIGIVYGILMARLLDPVHFGVFGLARFFFSLFDLRSKLGLDYAFIHRHPTTEELVATHWILQISAACLSLVLMAGTAVVVSRMGYPAETAPIMIALSAAMIIDAAGATARTVLEKDLVFARSTVVVTTSLALSYVASVVMAAQGLTYWAFVGQVAVNALVGSIGFWWAYYRLEQRLPLHFKFDRQIAIWMLRFGAIWSIGAVAVAVLLQFDNFLVGTLVSTAALGFYTQAYKMAQWPTGLVTHIVSRTSLPTYAKLQDDPVRLSKAFELSLWLILTVALPLALAIFAAAPDFVQLLYGEKWLPSALLLRFLIGYSVLRPLLDDTGALFTSTGQPKRVMIVLVAQAVTLALAATPLTLALGAVGTAIGVGIAFIVGIVLTYHFITQTIVTDLRRLFTAPIIATIGTLTFFFVIANLVRLDSLPLLLRVIVKGSLAAGGFGLIDLALERRILIERAGYIWRILRSKPG